LSTLARADTRSRNDHRAALLRRLGVDHGVDRGAEIAGQVRERGYALVLELHKRGKIELAACCLLNFRQLLFVFLPAVEGTLEVLKLQG